MISPLTGKDGSQLLARLNPKEISEKWQKSMGIDIGDEFRDLEAIEYWKCPVTNFHWYSPEQAVGSDHLYIQLQKFPWYYMTNKWEFVATTKLLDPKSSILEVGVGGGHFLELARNLGHQVCGTELNPAAAESARMRGFQIHQQDFNKLKPTTGLLFDAVCSFQVLEHIAKPREFIENMIGLLKPGGKLYISVPNAIVMRRIDKHHEDLLNQPPHHLGHWDEYVFRALENLLPLKVKSIHREPLADYHVDWMVNGYLRTILSPLGKRLSQRAINRYSTLPLRWMMQAGLRKCFPGHTLLVELELQNR